MTGEKGVGRLLMAGAEVREAMGTDHIGPL